MSTQAIPQSTQSKSSQQSIDDTLAEIARLRAENEALRKSKSTQGLTLKVSAKGAVSVYGMGRWPVTLYAEQWGRLLGHAEAIRKFCAENDSKLSHKGDATEAEPSTGKSSGF